MEKQDWYNELSKEQKRSIQKGLDDLDNGKIISHEEVMLKVKAKLQDLKK